MGKEAAKIQEVDHVTHDANRSNIKETPWNLPSISGTLRQLAHSLIVTATSSLTVPYTIKAFPFPF